MKAWPNWPRPDERIPKQTETEERRRVLDALKAEGWRVVKLDHRDKDSYLLGRHQSGVWMYRIVEEA